MTEVEIKTELFHILEVDIMKREIGISEINRLRDRIMELISAYPEGPNKVKVVEKIKDKNRFCYYINNTGILDFTGYGGNFW